MIDAIKGSFEMSNKGHDSISIESIDLSFKMSMRDTDKLEMKILKLCEKSKHKVISLKIFKIDLTVVDIDKILNKVRFTSNIFS